MPYGSGYIPETLKIGRHGGVLSQNRSEFGFGTWHRFDAVEGAMPTRPEPAAVYRSMVTPPKQYAPFGRRALFPIVGAGKIRIGRSAEIDAEVGVERGTDLVVLDGGVAVQHRAVAVQIVPGSRLAFVAERVAGGRVRNHVAEHVFAGV